MRHIVETIDAHTEGEPLRVVRSGFPEVKGSTILEKRRYARDHLDHFRTALMLEPRGHADMYGCVLVDPEPQEILPTGTPPGHIGVLFLHNAGYSTMCGHGILGLVKVGIEYSLFPWEAKDKNQALVRIDSPAGRVEATAKLQAGKVEAVSFLNVESFVLKRGIELTLSTTVPSLPTRIRADIAYGGAFYAYVDAPSIGLDLSPSNLEQIIQAGRAVKHAANQLEIAAHPSGQKDLEFIYGTIFVAPPHALDRPGVPHSRNVCVFADGEVDRCPTGTGVSGRAALHCEDGSLRAGESLVIESLIGTRFHVSVEETTSLVWQGRDRAPLEAVVPRVSGQAYITGEHRFFLDDDDPLAEGILLR